MPRTPLNLVTLLGSLRKASFNAIIARTLPELAPEDVAITPLPTIGDLPIYDADLQAQGIPPKVVAMGEAIRAADGVIIVTPEYNYSIPGGLKNAIDWISRLQPQPFARKPVALQSASPGGLGGARAQYHLRQVMVQLDALVLNKPEVIVREVSAKVDANAGSLTDPTTRDVIASQLLAFAGFVRQMAPHRS
ncbi:MAG TPA: NADPH-dependent FMN reductase [Hyphomicrobiaceae bacterium]|nr:NADPH-dependent FMN reductase [Hyphomicrobiaceae bacterium]